MRTIRSALLGTALAAVALPALAQPTPPPTGGPRGPAAMFARIDANGWILWPPIPFRYDTVVKDLAVPAPSPPSFRNWLGTDDQARDVLARVIYGIRLSVLFGFTLTLVSSAIGIAAGAVQGACT